MNSVESLSVVVPVWNGEKFLAAALESIHRQQHAPLEVIVVDDGSTDGSVAVAQQFSFVHCIRCPHRGISATRNEGVRHAQGRLLAFLDADDLWTEHKLAWQLGALRQNPEIDLVSGAVEQFFDDTYQGPRAPTQQTSDGPVAGSILVRRDAFERAGLFDESLKLGEFIDWYSRAIAAGLQMSRHSDIVLRRRIHGANTVLNSRADVGDYLSVIRSHLSRRRAA